MIGNKTQAVSINLVIALETAIMNVCVLCRASTLLKDRGTIHFLVYTVGHHIICMSMHHGFKAKCFEQGSNKIYFDI